MKSWLIGLTVFVISCSPILDCQLDPNSSEMTIDFNHDEVTTFTFDSVKNGQLSTVFFDGDTTFSSIQVPLTEETNEITYFFFTDSTDYSLQVFYDSEVNLYGEDCPPSVYFSNITLGSYNFDTVIVSNSYLDRRITNNIEVFF